MSARRNASRVPKRRRPRALECWPGIARRLRKAEHLALFLDFDGTLAPLCRRPEQAQVEKGARSVVRRLARRPRVTVFIISGRRLSDLRRRVNVLGVLYAGLYGWECNGDPSLDRAQRSALLRARRLLARRFAGLADIRVEDKEFSFAVHHRDAAGGVAARARLILRRTLEPFRQHLKLLRGHKIWEVLPRDIPGKGGAVRAMMEQLPVGALPIYIGDDVTDEAAFAALPGGLTVRVGASRRTRARYRLRDPHGVRCFLERLEAEAG